MSKATRENIEALRALISAKGITIKRASELLDVPVGTYRAKIERRSAMEAEQLEEWRKKVKAI